MQAKGGAFADWAEGPFGLHFRFPALVIASSTQPRASYEHYSED